MPLPARHGDALPVGIPHLKMGFTEDGQVNPNLVAERDGRMNVSTEKNRASREPIPLPPVLPGADDWKRGEAAQLGLEYRPMKKP